MFARPTKVAEAKEVKFAPLASQQTRSQKGTTKQDLSFNLGHFESGKSCANNSPPAWSLAWLTAELAICINPLPAFHSPAPLQRKCRRAQEPAPACGGSTSSTLDVMIFQWLYLEIFYFPLGAKQAALAAIRNKTNSRQPIFGVGRNVSLVNGCAAFLGSRRRDSDFSEIHSWPGLLALAARS